VLICDAVFEVDAIARHANDRARNKETSTTGLILSASCDVHGSIICAVAILLIAVAPIAFMGGTTAAFFRPLAVAYAIALGASLVVMLTVTPALARLLLRDKRSSSTAEPTSSALQLGYDRALSRVKHHRSFILAILVALVLACICVFPLASSSML